MAKPKMNTQTNLIGERIKQGRTALELTQVQLAKQAALSRSAVVHYEQGNAVPGGVELMKLAQALNLSPNYLLSGSDTFFPSRSPQHALADTEDPQLLVARAGMFLMVLDREVRETFSALLMALVKAKLNKREYKQLTEAIGLVSGTLPEVLPELDKVAEKAAEKILAQPENKKAARINKTNKNNPVLRNKS